MVYISQFRIDSDPWCIVGIRYSVCSTELDFISPGNDFQSGQFVRVESEKYYK